MIQRAVEYDPAADPQVGWETVATLPAAPETAATTGTRTWTDPIGDTTQLFYYRVLAVNAVGDTWDYTDPNLNEGAGIPSLSLESDSSNVTTSRGDPPAMPENLRATEGVDVNGKRAVTLTWDDTANETAYFVQRATNIDFVGTAPKVKLAENVTQHTFDGLTRGTVYYFRVWARNGAGDSRPNVIRVAPPAP